jgi:hypothetical protein
VSKNLLHDRRFVEKFDLEVGGREKTKKKPSRNEMGTERKQRDKTRRAPKEY